jgi:peptidoglycan/xylan/chitin deacetylase (PgdA/CDA1 family)
VPTNKDNFFERASALGYLGFLGTLEYQSRAGELYEDGKLIEAYQIIDEAYAKVRHGAFKSKPGSNAAASDREILSWDDLNALAKKGYEISSHTITHPRLAVLDEPNLVYELEKSRQDILDHLSPKHTFTIECPYGTEDERVVVHALARYPASRNRMPERFLEELNRGSTKDPGASTKEYVQWQRGVLTKTPMKLMNSWIDTIAAHDNMWLVLVFHGVDGVGWEPKTGKELKEYFNYIKSKESQLWVATFQDVTKYMREREHSRVQTSRRGDVIEVVLCHDLKTESYDLPLTLKTCVPPEWSVVEVRQGNQVKSVQVDRDNRKAYAMYQAVPNGQPVTLTKEGT